jgi:TetR/AcrR family transcriptional regulator, cholesterol catabolism regulator
VPREVTLPQPVATMGQSQLARRARLTDAVIEMVAEQDPDRIQMRDVAERSGVALATAYRYFSSKDHLLAASWAAWQRRLTDRVRGEISGSSIRRRTDNGSSPDETVADQVVAYVHRELRAFQRHPNFAKLVSHVQASNDPFASEEMASIGSDNLGLLIEMMDGVPAEVAEPASTAINAVLGTSLNNWSTGRVALSHVYSTTEAVIRLVLRGY